MFDVGVCFSWFVPVGLLRWFTSVGCKNVTELSWWDSATLERDDKKLEIICTPAQHGSLRNGRDANEVRAPALSHRYHEFTAHVG